MDQVKVRSLIMEFIGTFSLIFIGGWSVFAAEKSSVLIAAAGHGAVLGIMVYIGAKISGGHYNPAVTLGLAFTGNIDIINGVAYIFSQLLGSLFAGACLNWMKPGIYAKNGSKLGFPHLDKSATPAQGFFMEMFGAFFLIFSIYACAVHRKASAASCAAIIGITLFFGICAFGPVTGGALNPARTFGPSLIAKEFNMRAWWIYYCGPTLGGILAALIYEFIFNDVEHDYSPANGDETEGITSEMNKK